MSIPAKQVMELRAATGLPMMKCKKALEAEGGDYEKAFDRLRKEGLKAAEGRAGRATGEGVIRASVSDDGATGSLLAVACETEPVSNTALFKEFVDRLLAHVQASGTTDVDALLEQTWADEADEIVGDGLKSLIAKLGENIRVQGVAQVALDGTGVVGQYVHFNGKAGAMAAISADAVTDEVVECAKELCMHVVSSKPTVLAREEISDEVREKEMEIFRGQVQEDPKMANKPAEVLEKIVEGKLNAFYKAQVLPEQPWIKDDKRTVADVLKQAGAAVTAFHLFQVGA